MSTIQHAAELNNQGVTLLVNGDEQPALQAFKRSLVIVRSCLTDNECGEQPPPASSGCKSSVHLSSAAVSGCKQDQSFIYNRAITIQCTSRSSDEQSLVSAAIIFNMGLVYQLLDSRLKSSCNQTRALRLYEMCNGLLEPCTTGDHRTAAGLLAIACLNNMSQILYDQGDFSRNRLVIGNLQYLMSATLDWGLFNDNDIQGIMLNVMLMNLPVGARAA